MEVKNGAIDGNAVSSFFVGLPTQPHRPWNLRGYTGRPFIGRFMIIPLHQLRHSGIEAPDVLIEQIVDVIAAEFRQGFCYFGLFRRGEILPNAAII